MAAWNYCMTGRRLEINWGWRQEYRRFIVCKGGAGRGKAWTFPKNTLEDVISAKLKEASG
jgi:hypothetical protein